MLPSNSVTGEDATMANAPSNMLPVGLTYGQAAWVLGISRRSLERLVADGAIRAARPSPGRVTFLLDDLLVHLQVNTDGGTPEYERLVRDRLHADERTPLYEAVREALARQAEDEQRADKSA